VLPIKCPQCGLVNDPNDVGFPQCSGCGEGLVDCAACRHYSDLACDDPVGGKLFSPGRNSAPKCPSYRSRYAVAGSRWLQSLPAPAWVATALLLVLLGITALIAYVDPNGTLWVNRERLYVNVVVPAQMKVGVLNTIEVTVENPSGHRGSRYYLELEGTLCSNVFAEMSMPSPEPISLSRDVKGLKYQLEYPPVRDWKKIRLYFRPKRTGEQTIVVKLYTSGLARGQNWEGRTIVVNATGPATVRKEDQTHER
jgi:hypothetical protein